MIKEVIFNKKDFLELLLLGDEQESMIDQYLHKGNLYVLYENDQPIGVCVVLAVNKNTLEIKNLAIAPRIQRQGYGKQLVDFVINQYKGIYSHLIVGTGDSPLTLPFYQKCGFQVSHRIKNFFVDHYDHPIYEEGLQLVDMVYLSMTL